MLTRCPSRRRDTLLIVTSSAYHAACSCAVTYLGSQYLGRDSEQGLSHAKRSTTGVDLTTVFDLDIEA